MISRSTTGSRLRYPSEQRRQMTIAAGFRTHNGVLLCADQLHVSMDGIASYAPKIIAGETQGEVKCRYGFAYAGSKANAELAIRNLQRTIRDHASGDFDTLLQAMEKSVRSTNRHYVTSKPESERDANRFELLVAVNRDRDNNTQLMATADGALNPIEKDYHFLGVGGAYGECVGRVAPQAGLSSLEIALVLANRSLATAKRYSNDCGGPSNFTFISNNVPTLLTFGQPFIEDYVTEYEATMDRILLACVHDGSTDSTIISEFETLKQSAQLLRFKWRSSIVTTDMQLDGRLIISRRSDPQSTKDAQLNQPPSPEKPEECDES